MASKQAVYEVFTRFRIDAKGWDKSLNRLSRSMTRTGKQMQNAGRNLTQSLTLPLALAGGAAVKFAVDLEQSFAKIQNLVGVSTDTLKGFTQEVGRISSVTGEAQKSLADALFVVTSAGERGAEAIQILEQASKASAAGLGNTAEIARTVTAVLQSYGKENITAARATDVLFATVREGNLEAESLANALGPVLGLAAKLGVSFEEVGANIATFTRLGVSAEQAATSLQAIFSTFLKPTEGARAALAEFGLTAEQVRNKIAKDGLASTMIDLTERVGDNDEALAEIIPNIRALRGVLGTAGVQADSYADILKSIATNTDLVDQGFENVSKTAGFQFKQALTELQNVAIQLGNVLIPVLVNVAKGIKALIARFNSIPDSTKKFIVQIGLVVAAVGPALFIFGKLLVILGTVAKLMRTVAIASGLANIQILAIVAAVAALVVGILYVIDNWEALKSRITDWRWWENALIDMNIIMLRKFETLLNGWNYLANSITMAVRDMVNGVKKLLGFEVEVDDEPLEQTSNIFTDIIEKLEGMKNVTAQNKKEFQSFGDFVEGRAGGIKKAIDSFFSFGGSATSIVTPEGGTGQGRIDRTRGLPELSAIGSGITGQENINAMSASLETLGLRLKQVNSGWDQLAEKGQGTADIITGVLTSAFDGLGNAIISGFEKGQEGLKQFGQFFIDFAKGLLAKMISLIATALILSAVLSTIGFGIGAGGGAAKGIGFAKSIGNILKGGIPSLAVGTDYVNRDGLAMLHKGEQVVPANVNGGGYGGGNNQLVAVVKGGDLNFVLEEYKRKSGNTT